MRQVPSIQSVSPVYVAGTTCFLQGMHYQDIGIRAKAETQTPELWCGTWTSWKMSQYLWEIPVPYRVLKYVLCLWLVTTDYKRKRLHFSYSVVFPEPRILPDPYYIFYNICWRKINCEWIWITNMHFVWIRCNNRGMTCTLCSTVICICFPLFPL